MPFLKTDHCLLGQTDYDSHEIVKLYSHYENGNFMAIGSILDQPVFYRQSMELIESILNYEKSK